MAFVMQFTFPLSNPNIVLSTLVNSKVGLTCLENFWRPMSSNYLNPYLGHGLRTPVILM